MRIIFKLPILLVFLAFTSCDLYNSEPATKNQYFEDWILLKIPNGMNTYAISGSIDDVLVVTTLTKVYATKDGGETWDEVADFQGPMPGLLERNDSLFIFASSSQGEDIEKAGTCMYFSTDKGLTWQVDRERIYSNWSIPIKYVEVENDISYKIEENTFKLDGSETEYLGTSDIEKTIDDHTKNLKTPFEYILNNLHLDEQNRLYVAASYGTVNDDGTVTSGDRNSPALVFISKKPLP